VRILGTLNVRDVDPDIVEIVTTHKYAHGHKNITQALECIVREWAQQRVIKNIDTEKENLQELIRKIEKLIQAISTV